MLTTVRDINLAILVITLFSTGYSKNVKLNNNENDLHNVPALESRIDKEPEINFKTVSFVLDPSKNEEWKDAEERQELGDKKGPTGLSRIGLLRSFKPKYRVVRQVKAGYSDLYSQLPSAPPYSNPYSNYHPGQSSTFYNPSAQNTSQWRPQNSNHYPYPTYPSQSPAYKPYNYTQPFNHSNVPSHSPHTGQYPTYNNTVTPRMPYNPSNGLYPSYNNTGKYPSGQHYQGYPSHNPGYRVNSTTPPYNPSSRPYYQPGQRPINNNFPNSSSNYPNQYDYLTSRPKVYYPGSYPSVNNSRPTYSSLPGSSATNSSYSGNPYGQPLYNSGQQPPYGQLPYNSGQMLPYGQSPYNGGQQPTYGQPPNYSGQQPPYGQQPNYSGQQPPYGQPPRGQYPHSQPPYGQSNNGQNSGHSSYSHVNPIPNNFYSNSSTHNTNLYNTQSPFYPLPNGQYPNYNSNPSYRPGGPYNPSIPDRPPRSNSDQTHFFYPPNSNLTQYDPASHKPEHFY